MSNEPEMVTVRIQGSMTVHLDQTIKMTRQKFEELEALWLNEDGLGICDAEKFLDPLDITDPASVDYDDVDGFELIEA